MGHRFLLLIALGVLPLVGCGDHSRSTRSRMQTTDLTTSNTPNRQSNGPTNAPTAPTPYQTPEPAPQNDSEVKKEAPLIFKPERFMRLQPYQMPDALRERLEKVQPDLVPRFSKDFQVFNQHLKISKDTSTMTFTGVLRIAGKPDEPLEMSCTFDKEKPTWACTDMVPTDESIAKTLRLQASAECTNPTDLPQPCTDTSLELYVVIDGKTQSQLFQSDRFIVRRGQSGDGEIDEQGEGDEGIPAYQPPSQEKYRNKPSLEQIPDEEPNQTPKYLEKPTRGEGKFTNRVEDLEEPSQTRPSREKKPAAPTPTTPVQKDSGGTTEVMSNIDDEEEEMEEEETLTDEELRAIMDDPNAVLELTPANLPQSPTSGRYTIPNIENYRPRIGSDVPEQAIGYHFRGHLELATKMPDQGEGYQCRKREDRSYGTRLMVDLLRSATADVNKKFPNRWPFIIADISKRTGGRLCGRTSCHASHQTGLDADVVFPSSRPENEMWKACPIGEASVNRRGRVVRRNVCRSGGGVVEQFDEARFFHFAQHMMTCSEKQPTVVAMFVDKEIKRHMCRWAKDRGFNLTDPSSCAYKTLRAMKHEPSHYNHVHVRLRCPGNRRCRYQQITLGNGTGC